MAIVVTSMGFWALGMRGMMITTAGEDYMILAEAKGLRPSRVFWLYGVRNSILPQVTALALSLGGIVGGAMLVEYIFAYPGVGYLLYHGHRHLRLHADPGHRLYADLHHRYAGADSGPDLSAHRSAHHVRTRLKDVDNGPKHACQPAGAAPQEIAYQSLGFAVAEPQIYVGLGHGLVHHADGACWAPVLAETLS